MVDTKSRRSNPASQGKGTKRVGKHTGANQSAKSRPRGGTGRRWPRESARSLRSPSGTLVFTRSVNVGRPCPLPTGRGIICLGRIIHASLRHPHRVPPECPLPHPEGARERGTFLDPLSPLRERDGASSRGFVASAQPSGSARGVRGPFRRTKRLHE